MEDLSDLVFTRTHEWVRRSGDVIVVGITDYAQHALSEIVSVELPEADDHHYEACEEIGITESSDTSREFKAPVSGIVVGVNSVLHSHPELINSDPYGKGWLIEMAPDNIADIDDLMHVDDYEDWLPDEE